MASRQHPATRGHYFREKTSMVLCLHEDADSATEPLAEPRARSLGNRLLATLGCFHAAESSYHWSVDQPTG